MQKKINVMKRQSAFIPKKQQKQNMHYQYLLFGNEEFSNNLKWRAADKSCPGWSREEKGRFFRQKWKSVFFSRDIGKKLPEVKKTEGAFALYRVASSGQGGYSLEWFRKSCSVGSSSTLYVVPVQKYLDLGLTDEEQVRKIIPLDFF